MPRFLRVLSFTAVVSAVSGCAVLHCSMLHCCCAVLYRALLCFTSPCFYAIVPCCAVLCCPFQAVVHYTGRLGAKQGWRLDSTFEHKDEYGAQSPLSLSSAHPRFDSSLTLHYCTKQYRTVLFCTVLYYTVSTILYSTALCIFCCTVLYCLFPSAGDQRAVHCCELHEGGGIARAIIPPPAAYRSTEGDPCPQREHLGPYCE